MESFPFIGGSKQLHTTVESIASSSLHIDVEVVPLKNSQKALEYLSIEMPELVFVDFSDPDINGFELLSRTMSDPWLLHGGIIALCKDYDCARKLEETRGANIIVVLTYSDIEYHLAKVMDIIHNNRRILFQREIGADLVSSISASYKLENDLVVASCYANLICNFLFNTGRLDIEGRSRLNLALNEMLINGIEHGNCGITYDEKSQWLADGKMMSELIAGKCANPSIGNRRVTFEYRIDPDRSHFLIADEGAGFDWRNVKDARLDENIFELHGRGILVTRQFTRNLVYNDKGNEVQFDVEYPENTGGMTPGLFQHIEPRTLVEGETIFSQGEPSNFLYYIVKGRYDVLVNDNVVSTLSPDDIFVGEMSFLLNNRRSATVRARTPGQLIQISKKQFVEAIKKKPHYALFLCRLLAQRIQRGNASRASGNK